MIKTVLSSMLTVLCVLFLLFAPSFFMPGIGINIYTLREEKKESKYEGFITLWHVSDYPSVARAQLARSVRGIEKGNVHVFIETENLNAQTAKKRLAAGEVPDILSFQAGFIDDSLLLTPLSDNEWVIPAVRETALADGQMLALPYMATVLFPDSESAEEGGTAPVYVQYIALPQVQTPDQQKTDMCLALIENLMGEDQQKNLIKNDAVPVCVYPGLYETESRYSMAYEALFDALALPGIFEAGDT